LTQAEFKTLSEFAAEASLAAIFDRTRFVMAKPEIIKTIAMTMSSSRNVNPRVFVVRFMVEPLPAKYFLFTAATMALLCILDPFLIAIDATACTVSDKRYA
jgi:hypothetical protein